jgi:hypothetical protein
MGRWLERYRVDTEPLRSERRLELLLIVLLLVLLVYALYQAIRLATLDPPAPIAPSDDSLRVAEAPVRPLPDEAAQRELLSRPLFWSSRRPAPAAGEAPAVAQVEDKSGNIDNVQLLGVFGEGGSAGIIARVRGRQQRVVVGGAVEGWTLEEVGLDRAVFSRAGVSRSVLLRKASTITAGTGAARTE